MRHALLVTLSSPRYFRQLTIWPRAWPWLVLLALLMIFSLFVSNGLWLWHWWLHKETQQVNQYLQAEQQILRTEIHILASSIQALEVPLAGLAPIQYREPVDLPGMAAANLVALENSNQEYQLAILAMENRLQELSFQRIQMQREIEDMRLDKARWQDSWLTLQALLGTATPITDSMEGVDVVNDARQKLDAMGQIPSGWPLRTSSRVTSAYGMRLHPIEKVHRKHNGIDLACNKGELVLATAPGVVSESHYSKGFGHQVTVTHNFGFRSRYAHLKERQVKIGQWVDKQEVIGLCGQSGLANGPHLHYEVRYLNSPLNPALFINWQLGQFDRLVTNTGNIIPWPSLLKQIANRPHLINNIKTASP